MKYIIILSFVVAIIGRMQLYDLIPRLKISPEGVFKYILIEAKVDNKEAAIFVRGDKKYGYHDDNLKAFKDELKNAGFS